MPLIRQADSESIAHDAVVLNLGDLRGQADSIIAAARNEARILREQGKAERASLVAGGREEGFAKGLAEGRADGLKKGTEEGRAAALAEHRAKLDQLEKSWGGAFAAFESARDELYEQARTDVLRLALLIAEKVTRRVVASSPETIAAQLEAVLAAASRSTRLAVSVCPADEEIARRALPKIIQKLGNVKHAEIIADSALRPGACIARCDSTGATIDGSILSQLDEIAAQLVPGVAVFAPASTTDDAAPEAPACEDTTAPAPKPANPAEGAP